MKSNKNNKFKYIVLAVILIALIILLIFFLQKNNSRITKIGEIKENIDWYSLNVAGTTIDTSNVLSSEPNLPQIGAGMIPIKWDGTYWQITDINDNEWYDYASGKFATIMLSNGKYISEERYDMGKHEIAKLGTQIQNEEDLGTIYVWLPRLVYYNDDLMYLVKNSIVETLDFKLPTCFTYTQPNQLEMALTGIWIEQTPKESTDLVSEQIDLMKEEDNDFGLIRNEIIENIDNTTKRVLNVLQNGKEENKQQVQNTENTNRTTIKIINMNYNTAIITIKRFENKQSYIEIEYSTNPIVEVRSLDTNEPISFDGKVATMETPINKIYKFAVIDDQGNIKIISITTGVIVDLTGFRIDTTYIATYENEIEQSNTPIRDILSESDLKYNLITMQLESGSVINTDWYNYDEQKWANIVTVNNGNEAHFVWIPRYVYKLNEAEQSTDIIFVNTENEPFNGEDITGYILPDAFTWIKNDGEELQLPGYWIGKYAVSDEITFNLTAKVIGGAGKIKLKNIENNLNLENTTYVIEIYNALGEKIINTQNSETNYEFTGIEQGDYTIKIILKDSQGRTRGDKTFTTSVRGAQVVLPVGLPDLTGYRVDTTYLVTYLDPNDTSTMDDSSIKLEDVLSDNCVVDSTTNTLKSGTIDMNKVNQLLSGTGRVWYDYEDQKWANIVTKNNDKTAYFVWIPRYVYKLNEEEQSTDVIFVDINNKDEFGNSAPSDYILPDAFTWGDEDDQIELSGYWIGKYAVSN